MGIMKNSLFNKDTNAPRIIPALINSYYGTLNTALKKRIAGIFLAENKDYYSLSNVVL